MKPIRESHPGPWLRAMTTRVGATVMLWGAGLSAGLPLAGQAAEQPQDTPVAVVSSLQLLAQPMAADQATWQLPAEYSSSIGPVSVLQVRPDIYMLTVAGVNVAVETGWQATVVIGTAPAETCDALIAAVKTIAQAPIRYVVDTNVRADRIGCNASLAQAGHGLVRTPLECAAPVIAQQNALMELIRSGPQSYAAAAIPSEVFTLPVRNMYLNDQAIQIFWMPAAQTDGDSMTMFRRSDVVVAGDIMDELGFPVIDLAHGGSIQGELAALNRLLDEFAVSVSPKWQGAGGTLIIPGRGQLCTQTDVLNYRDMVTVIRDRVADLVAHGASLDQVQKSEPARGYDVRYGANSGKWTTSDFVAAIYQSLMAEKRGVKK